MQFPDGRCNVWAERRFLWFRWWEVVAILGERRFHPADAYEIAKRLASTGEALEILHEFAP